MLVILLFAASIYCDEEVLYGTFTKTNGNFVNSNYLNTHQVSPNDFSYSSSDSYPNQQISLAFDSRNENTYWVSNGPINETYKSYILINFHDTISLEGFIIDLAYRSREIRYFDGSPLELNVYSSINNDPLTLKYIFNGTYDQQISSDWTTIQFVFTMPLECDTLKIEFSKVTLDESFSHEYNSVVRNLLLVSYIDESLNVAIGPTTGNYADDNYVNEHRIPSSYFTYRTSGDKDGYPASNLFDDAYNSYWVSKDPNKESFKNYVIINFEGAITLEGFLYDTAYRTKGQVRNFDGFPTKLKVFTSTNNEPFRSIYHFYGNPVYPWTRIQFIFPEPVTCDKIKLEFTTVTQDVSFGGEYTACCGGMYLIQHISEEYQKILDEINTIFTDYAQLTLNESFTDEEIEELRRKSMQFASYETELKPIFERVEAIHKGSIKKDPHREFSTKPGSRNMLEQFGDSAGYCRDKLLLSSFGTNRQVIGIGGNTGKPIVIYVDAEPMEGQSKSSVRLPSITFTQILGSWQSSFRTSNLKLGRNSFVFPDIQTQGYSVFVEKGGPIHVNNPYTYETQRGHVTIYVEGGYVYPVFHRGDDEGSFRIILENYYNRLNDPNDLDITVDAFEAVSDHVMTSCSCTLAYNVYIGEGLSAQNNIDRWDDFLGKLLAFGGLPFDKNDPKYNPMNDHVRQNFRTVQPFAGFFAFAWTEMIGLPDTGTHRHCVQLTVPGWAFAHEFGHTVDKRGRIWGENTNNMWAMYNIFMMNREIYDRIPITAVHQNLGPDFSDYVTHEGGTYLMSSNPTVWWILEGCKPGYWADSENMFIYEESDRNENGQSIIGMTERLVYYASLSFGHNMSHYFERWGFCMDQDPVYNVGNRWSYEKSTEEFKTLMNQAKTNGRIDENEKKYWYINLDQYQYLFDHDNTLSEKEHCYDIDEYITPKSITKNGNSYIILLPEFKCSDTHLCYEVQSLIDNKWVTLGITYTQIYTDTYDYQDASPKYRIYAYDRLIDRTGDPPHDFEPEGGQDATCRIGETRYNTLNEAVEASQNGDTIVLLKSFMLQPLRLNKRVTIIPEEGLEEPIIISKINPGNLINIDGLGSGSPNVQIGDNIRVKIIFDGGGCKQDGSLIRVAGTRKLCLYNVELRNNINTNDGGAIYNGYDSHTEMTNCIVEKCSSSKCGGAAYLCGGQQGYHHVELIINNVLFKDNSCSQDGGAIDASGYMGYSRLVSSSDVIFENNVAGRNGGAIYAVKFQQFVGTIFRGNRAQNGGAIYCHCSSFEFKICSSNFSNNQATVNGSDIYLQSGYLLLNSGIYEGTIHKVTGTSIRFNKFSSADAELPDFSDATFTIDLPNGGNALFDVIDNPYVSLIENSIDTIKVQNGFAEYNTEQNKVFAYPSKSTITVRFNGQTYTFIAPYGDFVLPSTFEGFTEEYSITEWVKDSVTYKVGDTIFINQDLTFDVIAQKYCVVRIVYNEKVQVLRIVPNTVFYMPMTTPDEETVFGWECSDGNYYAYADPVVITTDLTFTAVLINKVTVTVQIGDNVDTYKLNYNEFFTLPTPPETLNGLTFKYFYSEDNDKYQPGDKISILNDIKFTAFYSNTISIVFVGPEDEQTVEYQQNEEIRLPHPGPENPNKPNTGREFIFWLIEGNKYYPFSRYTVTRNVQAVASYRLANKEAPVTITYEIPNVLSEYPHFVNGTTTRTEQHSFLENITLPGEDYFLKEPYGLGYDQNTSRENLFDYWIINGMRYNGSETFGLTEAFTAKLITKLSTKGLPTETPTQTPIETPTPSNLPTETPLPSDTPTPIPTEIKTDADVSDIDRVGNLVTLNLDCKIKNGDIKINLKCSTCLIKEYLWFTVSFEDGKMKDDIQFDDRDIYQVGNTFSKLNNFVNSIEFVESTQQLKFNTGSQYILIMDGQFENNLKCYPPPTSTPKPTESPSLSPTPKATPIADFSNREFTGEMSTSILDEKYNPSTIENAKFTDITLADDDSEYLIIVKKQMQFNNVHFIFPNTHIGAIKVDFTGDVTINNCIFTGCSVSNGNGNAILITENSETSQKIIQDCQFNSCGNNGYAVQSNKEVTIRNCNVEFNDQNSACGGFKILKCGSTITNCHLLNNKAKGAILYNPVESTVGSQFIIEQCTIENCEGIGFYNQLATLSPDQIVIRESSFINCVNPEMSSTNALGFNEVSDSFSLDVSNCVFRNCGNSGYIFGFTGMKVKDNYLESLISFNNVEFEFDSLNAGSGIEINQIGRKVLFHNCTFKQLRPNTETDDMVSAINAPSLADIVIEQSKFLGCGGGTVICIDDQDAEILIQNCTFNSFDSYSTGSPFSVRKDSISIIGNYFINCDTINIQSKILDPYEFRLIDNHFSQCTSGSVISMMDGLNIKPIIEGNVFEDINVNSELFSIIIAIDSISIDLVKNTFRNVTTKYGGFGGRFGYPNSDSESPVHVTFSQCHFLDSVQKTHGGAFHASDIQNNRNTKITFINCVFENNKAKAYGGAIYIDFTQDVDIVNCTFNFNLGGDGQGSAIFIESSDISVTITGCNFKDNADFEDDKLDGFAIISKARSIAISNSIIEYTDTSNSIAGLRIESTANSVIVDKCNFIKCSGTESTSFDIECQNSIQFTNNKIDSCLYNQNLGKIIIHGDVSEQTIDSCHFTNNNKVKSGPNSGLLVQKQTADNLKVIFESCEFKSNSASVESGGALSVNTISVLIKQCTFTSNNAEMNGGALLVSCATSISIEGSDFLDNLCNKRGGAIYIDYHPTNSESSRLLNDNAYCSITSCKFERNKASEYGNAIFVHETRENAVHNIQNNQFIDNYLDDSNAGYVIAASFFEIEYEQNTFNNQNANIPVNKFFLLTLVPSQSPSQSPSATPHPTITSIPGTNLNYINKEYIGTIPPCVNTEYQIQVQSDRDIQQISGCRFININHDKNYFIRIRKEIPFFDNYFEYNDPTLINAPAPIWAEDLPKITLLRCTFINSVTRKDDDGNVFSITRANTYITIDSCKFVNCGRGPDEFIFRFINEKSAIKILRCIFEFTDLSKSCKITNTMNSAHYIVINGSTFIGCAPNAIDFSICSENNFVPTEPFQFNDNTVKNSKGAILRGINIYSKPIIIGNTFQDSQLDGQFLFYISSPGPVVEINNTVFTNITTSGNSYGGGVAMILPSSRSSEITVSFNKCKFINNEALQASSSVTDGHYNGDGGAVHYGYDTLIVNSDMKFIDCTFKQNKAYRNGGALSLQTAGSVLIQNCIFEENVANNKGVASGELLYENHYGKKSAGVGGAIYINPTFTANGQDYHMTNITIFGCIFVKNKAFNGYAIYIEGDDLEIPILISANDFTNNFNENNSPEKGSIIASEILTLDKKEIENNNDFNNDELATGALPFSFVDHSANPIDLENPATPSRTPPPPDFVEEIVFDKNNYTENEDRTRVEKVVDGGEQTNVLIKLIADQFQGNTNDDGGAVHIINCGMECKQTHFIDCKSENGGGGGVYIKNSEDLMNNIHFEDLLFKNCQSQYGGAIYIYSSSKSNQVRIYSCTFESNSATLKESDNGLFGGSSIFLSTKRGSVRKCTFSDDGASESVLKIYNKFDSDTSVMALSNEALLSINECRFEMGPKSKCSLFYVGGIGGTNLNLEKCIFTGKLNKNACFIDGQMINEKSPKLMIKSCKFACAFERVFNKDMNNDFFSMDIKDQVFEFDEQSVNKSQKGNVQLIAIIAASAAAVIVIVVVIVVIVIKKKKNKSLTAVDQSEVEMSVDHNNSFDEALNLPLI